MGAFFVLIIVIYFHIREVNSAGEMGVAMSHVNSKKCPCRFCLLCIYVTCQI